MLIETVWEGERVKDYNIINKNHGVRNNWLWSAQTQMGHLCHIPSQVLRNQFETIGGKTIGARSGEDRSKTVSSRHSRTMAVMNTQRQWLPTQDPHKTKPANTQHEVGMSPYRGDMSHSMASGEGDSFFSLRIWPLASS